jgi:hypothetical protein
VESAGLRFMFPRSILLGFHNHQGESMPATTWKALIRLPNGNQQEVRVTANSQINARQMIEAQYARSSILFGVHKVDLTRW